MSQDKLPEGLSEILDGKAREPKAARNAIAFLFPEMRKGLGGFFSLSDAGPISRIERRISNRDFPPLISDLNRPAKLEKKGISRLLSHAPTHNFASMQSTPLVDKRPSSGSVI